ncbi:MAG: bifunctional hydroxymethylpyrimidine kinase/phosphomethylpyrimidine kinase [Persicimonas sp.]
MTYTRSLITVAGTDPSGGAGIQADLQVFRDWGFHGLSVITAIVAQNTAEVERFEPVSAQLLWDQLVMLLEDVEPWGIKVGMIPSAAAADELAGVLECIRDTNCIPIVFDPVMASSSSYSLQRPGTLQALEERVIPLVDVLTPNVREAEALLEVEIGDEDGLVDAAVELRELGCRYVLLKAGHLPGRGAQVSDVLAGPHGVTKLEPLETVDADVRGTGCQLSSALVAAMVEDVSIVDAANAARRYLNDLLHTRRESIGNGRPVIVRAETDRDYLDSLWEADE